MNARRPCPICLGTDSRLSDEDVTPQWVRKILAERLPDPSRRPQKTLVRICRECNAALNDKFENPSRAIVEPLIRGASSVTLSIDERSRVAAWVMKTSLVRIVGSSDRVESDPVTYDGAHRSLTALIEFAEPPAATSVRIGYYDQRPKFIRASDPAPRPFVIPIRAKSDDNYDSVASLGYLHWELLFSMSDDPSGIERLNKVQADDDRLLKIWPISTPAQSVSWPPGVLLDEPAVEAHKRAWRSSGRHYYTQKDWR